MIYALLADGFEEIEALAVVDILRRADIDIELVSVNSSKAVTGAHNIIVMADKTIDEINEYDMIFLPGGYPGYVNLENSAEVINILAECNNSKRIIAAICAAPSILGKQGMLNNKSACCFPGFENELKGAEVSFDDVVVCENIITSRGAGTAHKLGFKIVELLKGKDVADNLASTMIYKA